MKADYTCTQDELITGLYEVRDHLITEIVTFSGKKAKYNMAFIDAFTAAIKAADDAPDEKQRTADNEILRRKLVKYFIAEENTLERAPMEEKLGDLRGYIRSAWTDPVDRKVRTSQAGFDDMEKVMDQNWDVVQGMMNTAKEFIATHETALLMGGENMPATFKADFDALANLIIADVGLYIATKALIPIMTQEKIRLNNIAYAIGVDIMKDGQEYFKQNPAKKSLFTWVDVMNRVTPPGAAGLRGTVKMSGSNFALAGVVIELQKEGGTPVTFATDAEGKYYSGNLAAGVYSAKLAKGGFATVEMEVEIKTGVTSYKHWLMTAGGGTVTVRNGVFDVSGIANVEIPAGANEDTWVIVEGLGTDVQNYAADSASGEQTGSGALYANNGTPLMMKWSQVIAQIGLNAAHPFYNVKNVGSASGGWKVTFVVA